MKKFRNINYNYATPDDSFIARGLQLNEIVDEINGLTIGYPVELDDSGTDSIAIEIADIDEVDSVTIDYKYMFPDKIGANADQSGHIVVNNSSEHSETPALSWTRETINHSTGSEEIVTITFASTGGYLVMTITNTSGNAMLLTYTAKILNYVAS